MNLRVSNTRQLAVLALWSSCHLFLLATEVTCGCRAKGVKVSAVNGLSLSTRQLTPPDMKCDWRHSIVNRKKKKSASSFTILYGFDISQQHISDVLTHISGLHNATIGSWSESVSCRLFHTSCFRLCIFSLISSLLFLSLSAASAANSVPFSHYSHN